MNFCLQVDGPITDGGGGEGVLPAEVDAGCFTMCLRPLKIIIKLNLNQAARNPEIIIETMGNYTPIKRPPHLYKATPVTFFAVLTRVLPLLSPLLSGHQALDRLLLALFQEYDGEKQPEKESDDRLGTSNAAPFAYLLYNQVMLPLKIAG